LHQLNSPHLANSADQSWSRHQYTEPLGAPLFGLERLRKNCAEPAIMAHIRDTCNVLPALNSKYQHKNT